MMGVCLAKLPAPLAEGVIGHDDATDEQEFFHIPVAEREAEIQPDAMADNLGRKPMALLQGG